MGYLQMPPKSKINGQLTCSVHYFAKFRDKDIPYITPKGWGVGEPIPSGPYKNGEKVGESEMEKPKQSIGFCS